MTNKYHSRGDRPPSPGHPSCVPADKEKIVNCFYMRLITDLCGYKKKIKNVREHTNSWENISPPLLLAEGVFNKPFHEDGWSRMIVCGLRHSPSAQTFTELHL